MLLVLPSLKTKLIEIPLTSAVRTLKDNKKSSLEIILERYGGKNTSDEEYRYKCVNGFIHQHKSVNVNYDLGYKKGL